MRRLGLMIALLVLVLVVAAIPAAAEDHEPPPPPPHAHMLVQRVEIETIGEGDYLVGFRKCIDLAANHPLPLNSHHAHIHTGGTAVSFGNQLSGHWVVPTAPFFFPWANCAEFDAFVQETPIPLQ